MLAEALSRTDEIKLFESIVAECPEGYVKDILSGIALEVHDAIRNDFAVITSNLRGEVADLQDQKDRLLADTKRLREQNESMLLDYRRALSTIRQAEQLARQLKETVADIRDL